MASICFISLANIGIYPAGMVTGIFICPVQHGTRKKCCAYGRLLSTSDEFDEELTVEHDLSLLPNFLQCILYTDRDFTQKSSTYNNLVAMAATVVCNYRNSNGFTQCGEGPQYVFMNGWVHHYMRSASNTSQNCGLSLQQFVNPFERLHKHLQINKVWIMAISKQEKRFPRWHNDKLDGTITMIVVNLGKLP
jgi:hypothetical protein